MEDDPVVSGRLARVHTIGGRTGLDRTATIGFVDDEDGSSGSILVAAGSTDTAWARNLMADPVCRVEVGVRAFDAIAERLTPVEHSGAVRDLILRYGTPAEGLGRGASFRLRPVARATGPSRR